MEAFLLKLLLKDTSKKKMKQVTEQGNSHALLNPDRWDSTYRWMKLDIVIQREI